MARADELQRETLASRLAATRALTLALADPLSDADATIQPHPDASPAKWHLAHTTWFFETFVLRDHVRGYRLHDERWPFLFNSYYNGEGARHERARRGMISRPTLDEVRDWRCAVDAALADALPHLPPQPLALVELGIHHEQQHQELFLTDLLATFAANPLEPAYGALPPPSGEDASPPGWIEGREGLFEIGSDAGRFAFDCENPRHRALVHPHAIADRCVTNGEWIQFIADGGYRTASLWLSEGWDWVEANRVDRPLYWHEDIASAFTLGGARAIDRAAPVAHLSYYEADAFARWAGARLPTETEWEAAFADADPRAGHQLDRAGPVAPTPGNDPFGNVWQWTQSAYLPYPGFAPAAGTVGEYNGKFMCGQFVLKGASCATPRGHSRATYRNFFPPAARWQFTGVRLAQDR
ncbi:ergothioneine biosynthesis protein EgtB [Sphingomonas sp. ASV193]|uniref:ergothioneine biosynthesis protein EgtB n=1 Tax=Sphingomonas sp. ASV193 TaxID=3144405 RepID=UPI0032E864EA